MNAIHPKMDNNNCLALKFGLRTSLRDSLVEPTTLQCKVCPVKFAVRDPRLKILALSPGRIPVDPRLKP